MAIVDGSSDQARSSHVNLDAGAYSRRGLASEAPRVMT